MLHVEFVFALYTDSRPMGADWDAPSIGGYITIFDEQKELLKYKSIQPHFTEQ